MLDLYKTDAQIQVDRARVDAMRQFNLFNESLSQDPDYEKYMDRYQEADIQIYDSIAGTMTNRHARDLFYQEFRNISEQERHNVATIQQRERGKTLYGNEMAALEGALDFGFENANTAVTNAIFNLRASNIIDETKGEEIEATFWTSWNQRQFSRAAGEIYTEAGGIRGGLEEVEEWASSQTEFNITPEYQEQVMSGIRRTYQADLSAARDETNDAFLSAFRKGALTETMIENRVLEAVGGSGTKAFWYELLDAKKEGETEEGGTPKTATPETEDLVLNYVMSELARKHVGNQTSFQAEVDAICDRYGITNPAVRQKAYGYYDTGRNILGPAIDIIEAAKLPEVDEQRLISEVTRFIREYPNATEQDAMKAAQNRLATTKQRLIFEAIGQGETAGRGRPKKTEAETILEDIQNGAYIGIMDRPEAKSTIEQLGKQLRSMFEKKYGAGTISAPTVNTQSGEITFMAYGKYEVKYVYDPQVNDEILYFLNADGRWVPAEMRDSRGDIVPTSAWTNFRTPPRPRQ